MIGVAFICCTFVAKIKCHEWSIFSKSCSDLDLGQTEPDA